MQAKTIFISITRGGLARNILRAGILDKLLAQANLKIVIIVPCKIYDYFREEFDHPQIVLEQPADKRYNKLRKFFNVLFNGLVYTSTEHRKIRFGGGSKPPEPKLIFWSKHITFSILSKIKLVKYLARWIEQYLLIDKDYDYLFTKYKPDLLFCSSIYSKLDLTLIKAAQRFKVKSISMPKSWDTVGRLFFRAPSDKIILNNEFMREWVIKQQLIKPENIFITGFPQFDIYQNKKDFLTKEQFCKKTSLDSNKPIILYASEGRWTYWDEAYLDDLIKHHNILDKYNLILRPHFTNLEDKLYHRFKQPGVYVDDQHTRITNMFGDVWDMSSENMDWLAQVIKASDVVVTFMSTFVLDVFAFNKPVINIYYDLAPRPELVAKFNFPVIPMKELYNCTHYNAVLAEKPTAIAKNSKEVMEWIEKFLNNPKLLEQQRQNTINKLCYKLDGQASQRIANIILDNLN